MSVSMATNNFKAQNPQFWENHVSSDRIKAAIPDSVHPLLAKHASVFPPPEKNPKFFLPLCDDPADIGFLYTQGYDVFALSGNPSLIARLEAELGLRLKAQGADGIYGSGDGRLKIAIASGSDFSQLRVESWGPFDCVWDRGLSSVDYSQRDSYVDMMKRALAVRNVHPFNYLLDVFQYDKNKVGGQAQAPTSVDNGDLNWLFGSWAHFNLFESVSLGSNHPVRKGIKVPEIREKLYFLTIKIGNN